MKKTILNTMLLGLGLLCLGTLTSYGAAEEGEKQTSFHPVSQKEKDADATPGDIKKFFGAAQKAGDKMEDRAEKAGPKLEEAGKNIEKAVSTLFGRRDDKDN